jgi:cleavage and polyadenylation specificity factor subunit 3
MLLNSVPSELQVREIVGQRGHCLIPVVALGRAQELLLILEDCWSRHPELHDVPIHQTSGIAAQSLGIYQSYIEMMNENMRAAFRQRNPFDFKHVRHTRGFRAESELGPCVVLATPSMLQSGLSRELFEAWCEDARNGVVIADFAVQVRNNGILFWINTAHCCSFRQTRLTSPRSPFFRIAL